MISSKIRQLISSVKHKKCPRCGYGYASIDQPTAKAIVDSFEAETKGRLLYLRNLMKQHHPTENHDNNYFNFLSNIYDIDETILNNTIDLFVEREYHLQHKGYAYLMAIAYRSQEHSPQKIWFEKEKYGELPPVRHL